jgi:hypothetical protein
MSLSDKIYTVYWLHLKEHTDIRSEGYVGITSKTAEYRFDKHCKNADKGGEFVIHSAIRKHGKDSIFVDVICFTTDEHARWLEKSLRPEPFIGWNMQRGGIGNPYLTEDQKERQARNRANTLAQKGGLPSGENHHNWKGGCEQWKRKHGLFIKKDKQETSRRVKQKNREFLESGGIWPSSRPEVKEKFSEVHKQRFKDNGWWVNSQANRHMWLSAAKVMLFRKATALPRNLLAEMIGVSPKSIPKLTDKLFSGWNPLEDERWIKFYEQNKAEGDPTIEELTVLSRQS